MLGVVTVVMTLLGWSSVPLFVAYLSKYVDVWTQNGWRYAFSAAVWAPVLIVAHRRGVLPRGLWRASVVPAIANALGQGAFTWSFYNVDTATATFGLRMQIVFLAVGAYLLFPSERALLRNPRAWIGIGLVIVGIFGTIILRDRAQGVVGAVGGTGRSTLGVMAAIASGMLFASYGLSVRKYMHGFHPVTAFAAISQITAAISVIVMLVLARNPVTGVADFGLSGLQLGWFQQVMMYGSAIIGIALGHVFYYISIARLGVAVTSGVIQLQPFCVAIANAAISGIMLTRGQWLFGAVAVAGASLLLWVQWTLSRTPARARRLEAEFVAGDERIGVEAAEMDAMPVDVNGQVASVSRRDAAGAGTKDRQA